MQPRTLTLDYAKGRLEVQFDDGSLAAAPMSAKARAGGRSFARSSFDVPRSELTIELHDGTTITSDVGASGPGDEPPAGRPVVYIDQNHWITLARQLHAPHKVPERLRPAAAELIALAHAGEIVLPLAAAHLTETAPTYGQRRVDLARTMLELSRGWVMRHPLRVRQDELRAALAGRDLRAAAVFTLDPDIVFAAEATGWVPSPEFPPETRELLRRLVSVSALCSALLDPEAIPAEEARARATAWAVHHEPLATFMRENKTSREDARLNAVACLLGDLRLEIARAAQAEQVTGAAYAAWLYATTQGGLAGLPFVGRSLEILYERLINADDRWEGNDLNDLHFLGCAAAYAHVVVGEKKTTSFLRRVEPRVPAGAFVCRTLPDAVEHLAAIRSSAA